MGWDRGACGSGLVARCGFNLWLENGGPALATSTRPSIARRMLFGPQGGQSTTPNINHHDGQYACCFLHGHFSALDQATRQRALGAWWGQARQSNSPGGVVRSTSLIRLIAAPPTPPVRPLDGSQISVPALNVKTIRGIGSAQSGIYFVNA